MVAMRFIVDATLGLNNIYTFSHTKTQRAQSFYFHFFSFVISVSLCEDKNKLENDYILKITSLLLFLEDSASIG